MVFDDKLENPSSRVNYPYPDLSFALGTMIRFLLSGLSFFSVIIPFHQQS